MKLMAIIFTIPKLGPSQLLNTVDWQTAAKINILGQEINMIRECWLLHENHTKLP